MSGGGLAVRGCGEALPRVPWAEAWRSAARREEERVLRDQNWEPLTEVVDLAPPPTPRFAHEGIAAAAVRAVRTVTVTAAVRGHEDISRHVQQLDYSIFRREVDDPVAREEHEGQGDLPSLEEVLADLQLRQ